MNPDPRSLSDRLFEGAAFHPGLPGGRASGGVRIVGDAVRFESDKGGFELPLYGLKLELGGANDRLIFLTHPSHPQTTIHAADHDLLEHPIIATTPELRAQRARVRAKKRFAWVGLLSAVGLVVVAVVALFLARGRMVKVAANTVPVAWEVKAGDKLFEQMMLTRRMIKDPAIEAQLKQITDPLLGGIPDQRYPFTFHIVEDATLNAFAMPGGHVVIHSGLLLAADSAEEVAGVLAHEIAHVTQRHSIRNIVSSAGLYLALSAMIGDASGVIAVVADNSAFLLDRKFSRDFEREADETGWDYLVGSHIEPKGMITFFKKMEREEKALLEKSPVGGMSKALEIVSTHPATRERIARLEAKWQDHVKEAETRNIPLNYATFRESVRALLHAPAKENPLE